MYYTMVNIYLQQRRPQIVRLSHYRNALAYACVQIRASLRKKPQQVCYILAHASLHLHLLVRNQQQQLCLLFTETKTTKI